MRLKHLYPWLKRTFLRTLVEKESHRIYREMKRKRWEIVEKCMHLQGKRNRFILVDQKTDNEKANEQIERNSFSKRIRSYNIAY